MRIWPALALAAALAAQTPKPAALGAVCGSAEIAEFGLECSAEEPCPLYLELTSVASAGGKLLLAGNLHTQAATVWSVLLASDDDGRSWTEPYPAPARGQPGPDPVHRRAPAAGSAAPPPGAWPRDPFLLASSDGGRTWQRYALFEESPVGAVEQFHFDSKTHGFVVVDRKSARACRYQKLESMTGGSSWLTREVGPKPFPLPHAPASDWRLRVDAATQSFHIEHRAGPRWSGVAAFQVRAGACAPDPPKPQPPAEVPPQ